MNINQSAEQIVEDYKLQLLNECIVQLNKEEYDGFLRIFPNGIKSIKPKDIMPSINLCLRTIRKNNAEKATIDS